MLSEILSYNWWSVAIRGALSVAFGIALLVLPGAALFSMVIAFGVFAVGDGLFSVLSGFRRHHDKMGRWSTPMILGICSLAAGIAALTYPGLTAIGLAMLIGIWAVTIGFFELYIATALRMLIPGEGYMIFSGILSIVLGMVIFALPRAGAILLVFLIGAMSIVSGIFRLSAAWRLRAEWARRRTASERKIAA